MKIAGIYLAAGAGRRFGKSKASAELRPKVSLGSMGLCALLSIGLENVYVIVRPGAALNWLPSIEGETRDVQESAFTVVKCAEAEQGLAHSLRCGLSSAMAAQPDAVLVMLADQPFVTSQLLLSLIERWQANPLLDYVTSGYAELTSPPVLLSKSMFASFAELQGDEGAKRLLKSARYTGEAVYVSQSEILMDIDTPEDLKTAQLYMQSNLLGNKDGRTSKN